VLSGHVINQFVVARCICLFQLLRAANRDFSNVLGNMVDASPNTIFVTETTTVEITLMKTHKYVKPTVSHHVLLLLQCLYVAIRISVYVCFTL